MIKHIEWKYSKEAINQGHIQALEESFGINLPDSYKLLVLSYHGARPNKNRFDTRTKSGYVLKTFLPITERYDGNIIKVLSWLIDRLPAKLLPFASDAAGNYLCFHFNTVDPEIVLWKHETVTTERISSTFDQFISSLY